MQPHGHMFRCFCVRKSVGRTLWGHVCRFFLWIFLLELPALLPASQSASETVTIIFHPNYHLEDIQTEIDNVASDGLHPAVLTVKVLDHRNIEIPDVKVDWSVDESAPVEVSAKKTDDQGDSRASLRSKTDGEFNVAAFWHNKLGKTDIATSTVNFVKIERLNFTSKAVSVKFEPNGQFEQTVNGGNNPASVTYVSSCPEVAECDDLNPGSLTLKNVGATVITATEAGSNQFSEQSASYILNVEKATGDAPQFGDSTGTFTVKFPDPPSLNQAVEKKRRHYHLYIR